MSTSEPNKNIFCIYDSRIATLVSPNSHELVSTQTLANFLKPCSKTIHHSEPPPFHKNHYHPLPKIDFKGWKNPQTKWSDWVETLTAEHAVTWNQTGSCDALLSSLYHFPKNPYLILALVHHWSPKTNTFVFPWGEATITLEDVMILGGFSVLGESITLPLSSDLLSVEAKLIELRRRMSKTKSKKADHNTWLKFFKEGLEKEESHEIFELEHVGFLCLWLARFVFPSISDSGIDPRVFHIAIHLSQGRRIALAPSVLAGIYHNLSLLKEKLVSFSVKDLDLKVNGLFQLVQLWIFERFPILGPACPNELKKGEPRAARWHKLNNSETDNAGFEFIMSALESKENFRWRPYVYDLKNWCFVSHYKENEQFIVVDDGSNCGLADELRCFGVCLCADEIFDLDCVEKYMPYRVAMQFGMDQDVPPGDFTSMSPSCKGKFSLYVPAKCYKPCVSLEYHNWWKKSIVDDYDMLDEVMIAKQYCEEGKHASIGSIESGSKRKSSSNEENNSSIEVVEAKRLKKNEQSFNHGLNNDDDVGKGKEQYGVGSYDNPLDVEGYACTILGASSSHPISI
ncbi:uncharacterized protein LOC131637280 [Vicia villosa]|uniref:uncharacterized protein LOC131637280 n=1 Tax=Vicia villosa TaxID=3911 RepID=UPI00273ADF0E|nr:uncharacterized protein LOC131637280 [Vicia villosa]